MALGSTQPLTEMSTRSISWGKCGPVLRADNLTTILCRFHKIGGLNFLEPSGPLQACNGTALPLPFFYIRVICGPGSSVGIATDYGLDGSESNPGVDEDFRPYTLALGPAQPPVKWVPSLSRG